MHWLSSRLKFILKSRGGVELAQKLVVAALYLAVGSTVAMADEAKPELDTGDTAWMLTATALVLLMTIPGLVLFYGGMVRKKNVLATSEIPSFRASIFGNKVLN